MDANKIAKLREIEYEIPRTCETCIHAEFKPHTDFGVCTIYSYEHLRQTANDPALSIYRGGVCPEHIYHLGESLPIAEPWREFLAYE